jgi:predicted nucleic-acid-binding protein
MSAPFIETDVLIRFLTGDDPVKQAQAAELLQSMEAGKLVVEAPVTVIADAVYVLASPRLYRRSRVQVQALLSPIVRLSGFKLAERPAVLRALELHAATRLDFGDASAALIPLIVGLLTAFVAYGRWRLAPSQGAACPSMLPQAG